MVLCEKVRKCKKNDEHMSKEHRNQLESIPTGLIWDNFSVKIKDSNDLQPTEF